MRPNAALQIGIATIPFIYSFQVSVHSRHSCSRLDRNGL